MKSRLSPVFLIALLAGTACGNAVAGAGTPSAAVVQARAVAARVLAQAAAQIGQTPQVTAVSATATAPTTNSAPTGASTSAAAPTTAAAVADSLQTAIEAVYTQANPSVVYIVVSSGGNGFGYNSGGQASGSGFVYSQDGTIVTNDHVVAGAQTIEVVFADGSRQSATLIGGDAAHDLAVIKVAKLPASAKPLTLAPDGTVQVGEFVAAIGSPFGEQGSMSFGIVSALNRSLTSGSTRGGRLSNGSAVNTLIQTDAPINPGNSGGPLLNLDGQVIGIDTAIESTTGSSAGVGFAIPVSVIRQVVPGLIASGG